MATQVYFDDPDASPISYTATGREVLLEYIQAGAGGGSFATNSGGGGGGGYGSRGLVSSAISSEGDVLLFTVPMGGNGGSDAGGGQLRNDTQDQNIPVDDVVATPGGDQSGGGGGLVRSDTFDTATYAGGAGDWMGVGNKGGGGGSSASAAGIGSDGNADVGGDALTGGGDGGDGGVANADGSNGDNPGGGGGGAGDGGISDGGSGGNGLFTLTIADPLVMTNQHTFVVESGITSVGTLTATGDGPFVFDIVEGPDDGLFSINNVSGAIVFLSPPDYADPQDSSHNNVYNFVVRITDDWGLYVDQHIAVRIQRPSGTSNDTINTRDPVSWPGLYS